MCVWVFFFFLAQYLIQYDAKLLMEEGGAIRMLLRASTGHTQVLI
jgi:hypothetical protein